MEMESLEKVSMLDHLEVDLTQMIMQMVEADSTVETLKEVDSTLALTVVVKMLMEEEILDSMVEMLLMETVDSMEDLRVGDQKDIKRVTLGFMDQKEEVEETGETNIVTRQSVSSFVIRNKYGFMAINFSNLHIIQSCLN